MNDRVCVREGCLSERVGIKATYPVNGDILQRTSVPDPCQFAQSKRIHDTITPSCGGRQPSHVGAVVEVKVMTDVVGMINMIGTTFISLKTRQAFMLMMMRVVISGCRRTVR